MINLKDYIELFIPLILCLCFGKKMVSYPQQFLRIRIVYQLTELVDVMRMQ